MHEPAGHEPMGRYRGKRPRCRAGTAALALVSALLAPRLQADIAIEFIPATPAHRHAASVYAEIWNEHGPRIVASLERRTCLEFTEPSVAAIVADATSNSGGPEHPMRLRATYPLAVKQSTLVHELGHRHLWRLEAKPDEIDGHKLLFLVLDLVWADVFGKAFADERVAGESAWEMRYDYAAAWAWARALGSEERARLWGEVLALNGVDGGCRS